MDLNYDYGDVVHTHKHIHTKPDSHRQVVEHALKEWCHSYFGDDGEEKCTELNDVLHHDIDDGTHGNIKVSALYDVIKDLEKLNGEYLIFDSDGAVSERHLIKFKGTIIESTINSAPPSKSELKIEILDNLVIISSANKKYYLREDGIYYKSEPSADETKLQLSQGEFNEGVVINLKQMLRNLDMRKLETKIEKESEELDTQLKHLKNNKFDDKNLFDSERKLEKMEMVEKELQMELIILIILWIIAIMFGVYCIFTQFNLDL